MNTNSAQLDLLGALERAEGSVSALVDNLVKACPDVGFELCWHEEHCDARVAGIDARESPPLPLSKPVLRAMLARIAALCNEYKMNSVSPYGGSGTFCIQENDVETLFAAVFVNTPAEQRLKLVPVKTFTPRTQNSGRSRSPPPE
jgi:hypothetical protein